MARLRVTRKSYKRKGDARVPKTTYLAKDRGKPGRTPKSKRWHKEGIPSGWSKKDPPAIRRRNVLKAHKGNLLASARAKQSLANVTADPGTKRAARADALYFYQEYAKRKKKP